MVFGLFSKKSPKDKANEKGAKLLSQGRYAEALSWFVEAEECDPSCSVAREGVKNAKTGLIDMNIEEARAYATAEPSRAREHLKLAMEIAGADVELKKVVDEADRSLAIKNVPEPKKPEAPKRLFESSCGCGSSCGSGESSCGPDSCHPEEEVDVDQLFELYLEGYSKEEQKAFEGLGPFFKEGFVALQQGDIDEARKWLKKAQKEETTSAGLYYALALLEGVGGDGNNAVKFYNLAISMDPEFGPAYIHLASLLHDAKYPAEAEKVLKERLSKKPGDLDAEILMARVLAETGRVEEALEFFKPRATKDAEANPSVGVLWANLLAMGGRDDEAMAVLMGALARKPDSADILLPLGMLQLKKGEKYAEAAVNSFKKCYKSDQERGWYYLLLVAQAYHVWGRKKQAEEVLARAEEELPEDQHAYQEYDKVLALVRGS